MLQEHSIAVISQQHWQAPSMMMTPHTCDGYTISNHPTVTLVTIPFLVFTFQSQSPCSFNSTRSCGCANPLNTLPVCTTCTVREVARYMIHKFAIKSRFIRPMMELHSTKKFASTAQPNIPGLELKSSRKSPYS
jgi:hypothetical protein